MAANRIIKQRNRNKYQRGIDKCYLRNAAILICQNDVAHMIHFKWKVTSET